MVQSSSKKKRIAIALVVIFALMIFGGVGIGVYFFINDKNSDSGLSKNQIAFGTVINQFDSSPVLSRKNFGEQYSGSVQNVVCYSDEFLACVEDGKTNIVSLSQNQQVDLDFEFDEIISIFGKIAHVKKDGVSTLLNLETRNKIATFQNATVHCLGNFVLIKALKNSSFDYFENGRTEILTSLILNVSNGEKVFSSKFEDDIIDVYFEDNFAVIISSDKTLAFSLYNNFSKVLEFENVCETGSDDFNIESSLDSKKFFMSTFYKLNELSKKSLLVEKTVLTNNNDNSSKLIASKGDCHYTVEYDVYDTDLKAFAILSSSGFVFVAQKCDFSDSYVAVVKSEIFSDGTISENQTIEYYYLNSNKVSKNSFKLEKIISYDFLKFGKIVGYEKGKLLTKGGTMSGVIDFSGKQVSCVSTDAGETSESLSWKNSAIVFSSITGLKGVKNSNGEILFEAKFDKISPIVDKFMIAKMSDLFFVIDTDGSVFEISKFATEFEDYVFSGIGFFFTKANDGKYDVYKFDKTLYRSSVNVQILENEKGCLLCVGEDELFDVELVNGLQNKNLQIQKTGNFTLLSNFRSFGANAQNVAESSDNLEFSSTSVDGTTGAGFASITKDLSESELSNLQFLSYSELSEKQKGLVPTFDDQDEKSYSTSESKYVFDGACFWANENVMIVLVRLKKEGTEENAFLVNVALKNAYLKQAVVSGLKGAETSNFVWFDTAKKTSFDSSNKMIAPMSLNSKVIFFDETTSSRQVNYAPSGFDGGIVFVSDSGIKSISLNITISNIFTSTQNSEIYSFDENKTYDSENYEITVDKDSRKVTLLAKNGYAFKRASFVALEANSIVQAGDEVVVGTLNEYAKSVTIDFSSFGQQYFRVSNMEIIEEYSKLTLKDFEGSLEDSQTLYYFYGYGDNVSLTRNPAPFGFENFKRKTKVGVYSREGYTFNGFFAPNSTEDLAIDKDGEFIGNSTMFVVSSENNEFELNAKYTANEYTIYYDVDGVTRQETKKVTYDSKIGELLTEDDIGAVEGYEFIGWEYEGVLLTKDTDYCFSNDIKVTAKFKAKQWTLNLSSNINTYSSAKINGFYYKISKVVFVEDFGGYHAGDEVPSDLSKIITFGETYNLPKIKGESASGETYNLVYWSDSENFTVSGGNVSYGNVFCSDDIVDSDQPTETLYAHYVISLNERTLNFTSFVYNGTEYNKDPIVGGSVLTNAKVEYVDSTGVSTSKTYDGEFSISFFGTNAEAKLTITISEIPQYELKSYKMTKSGTEETIDCSVSGNTLVFEIDSSMGSDFDFKLYFEPYKFNVKFNINGNVNGETSSILNTPEELALLGDQTAYWDIDFKIPNVELQREGYEFKGYSLSTGGSVIYHQGDVVTDNFRVQDSSMTNGKQITLYAIWGQKTYTFKFVLRDSQSDYKFGSTIASSILDVNVEFGKEFELPEPSRIGYTFAGWWPRIEETETGNSIAGSLVSSEGTLNKELLESLPVDGTQIVLYAGWNAKEMIISFDNNDETGSSKANETLDGVKVIFDSGSIPTLPELLRKGYEFKGFNSQKLAVGETSTHMNLTAGSLLNSAFLSGYGFSCDENTTELKVFAVWEAKKFKVYLDTQKASLVGHKDNDEKLTFEITNWSDPDLNGYFKEVSFDQEFGVVPYVNVTGYANTGIFTSATDGDEIKPETVFDLVFMEKLTKTDDETAFKVFARYEKSSFNVEVTGNEDLESISPNESSNKEFYDNITFDLLTKEGKYVKKIKMIGLNETITINLSWNSDEKKVSISSVVSSLDGNVENEDDVTTLYKKLNFTSTINSSSKNEVQITIENIKAGFTFDVSDVENQQYEVLFYHYYNGSVEGESRKEEFNFKDGYELSQELLAEKIGHRYVKGQKFVGYYFATKSGSTFVKGELVSAQTIRENKVVLIAYDESPNQGVHFFIYDSSASSYVEWEFVEPDSAKFDETEGKIKELPSVGAYLWPKDTVLFGFVVLSSTPSNYLTKQGSSSMTEFSCSTMIEEELNVYAVYDKLYFTIDHSGSTLTCDYNLYQEINGAYVKLEVSDEYIKYYKLTKSEYDKFLKYIGKDGDTREVALSKVDKVEVTTFDSAGFYVGVILGANDTYYWVSQTVIDNS